MLVLILCSNSDNLSNIQDSISCYLGPFYSVTNLTKGLGLEPCLSYLCQPFSSSTLGVVLS